MRIKSRLIGALICLVMLVGVLQLSVLAADIEVKFEVPEGSDASLAPGTTIDAEEVMTSFSDTVRGNIETVVGKDAEIIIAYDITLLLDGEEIQPDGMIRITVPAPIESSKYDSIMVVYINSEGKAIPCDTVINADGTVTFLTDHLSRYAVIGVPKNTPSIAIIVIFIAALVTIGSSIIFRKKKVDEPTPAPEGAELGDEGEELEEINETEESEEGEEPEESEDDAE